MKKIIRLTESDLRDMIKESVTKVLKEGVLGNDWNADESDVMNNYQPFEDQIDAKDEFENQHDWGAQGDENIDPTYYGQHNDAIGWNDDEPEGYEEDLDWDRSDVNPMNNDPSDGDLYRVGW